MCPSPSPAHMEYRFPPEDFRTTRVSWDQNFTTTQTRRRTTVKAPPSPVLIKSPCRVFVRTFTRLRSERSIKFEQRSSATDHRSLRDTSSTPPLPPMHPKAERSWPTQAQISPPRPYTHNTSTSPELHRATHHAASPDAPLRARGTASGRKPPPETAWKGPDMGPHIHATATAMIF